ncbi:MAG: hypothetical protein Q8Q09_05330 [Deltaproteobacteria bacterium]|nr:hypothetical protein [Deltaproteobacteria bacterium]
MSNEKFDAAEVQTLHEEEITTTPRADRRTALSVFGATIAAGLTSLLSRGADARGRKSNEAGASDDEHHGNGLDATQVEGDETQEGIAQRCTDSDSGRFSDPPGRGRRCRRVRVRTRRSCSDSDGGRYGDPAGRGRRC